jgi:hypothetical protein
LADKSAKNPLMKDGVDVLLTAYPRELRSL